MPDIANYLAQNQPRFNRAAVDRQHMGNSLMRNEVARLPQQNRAEDLAIQASELGNQERQIENAKGILGRNLAIAASSARPLEATQALLASPDFQTAGGMLGIKPEQWTLDGETDESVRQKLQGWAQVLGMAGGGGEGFTLAPGHVRYDSSGREVARGERAASGNFELVPGPNGSLLQINRATGEVSQVLGREPGQPLESVVGDAGNPVLVPRDEAAGRQPYQRPTGGLSARDATTAKNKLNQIEVARQQLALVQEKFNALKGTASAGAFGQGLLPTESGKQFDAAVDSMRNVLSTITRVPGVGAMSDFETRLAQAQFPARGNYESVTQQQIDSIASMLAQLEDGYGGILTDSGVEIQQRQPAPNARAPQVGAVEDGYRFLGGDPSQPTSWQKVN